VYCPALEYRKYKLTSLSRPIIGSRTPSILDKSGQEIPSQSGIYVGIVKKLDTSTRTGRLWVYIKQLGGPEPDNSVNWKLVSYASPYFGQTSGIRGSEFSPAETRDANTFLKTTQTYGFFMIPPDVGNQVLCCFLEGSVEGYWFACINKSASIYMTPAIGATDYKYIDQYSIEQSGFILDPNKKYPVGEWNENLKSGYSQPVKEVKKPLHVYKTAQLLIQGLDGDEVRGTITSSSQRDPTSSVFGVSTPGRPIPPQDPALDSNLATKLATGNFNANNYIVSTRVGGHSLIMDDGDIYGKDNLVRLKSSAGHQVLLHDTEGIIYISNAAGSAWVELTKEGDILIYGARDMSVRTSGNLMMHSDKNISFFARENINFATTKNFNVEAQEINHTALVKLKSFGKKIETKSASTLDMVASSAMRIKASGKMAINGSTIALNGSGNSPNIENPVLLQKYTLPDVAAVPNGSVVQQVVFDGALFTTNYKVPTHEPYFRQGIEQAIEELQAQADVFDIDIDGNPISPQTIVNPEGPKIAEAADLVNAATPAAFISQPIPVDGIGELASTEVRAMFAQLGDAESGGLYSKIEEAGFVGKYQFSAEDLQKLGYIKEGLDSTIETLSNPNNWISKDNIANLDEFLSSPELQEQAIFNLAKDNYATLQATGAITKSTPKDVISGLLSVAHLAGAAGATTWFKTGRFGTDAPGFSATDYFNRGKFSLTQTDLYTDEQ
jgi:hypothetical protein